MCGLRYTALEEAAARVGQVLRQRSPSLSFIEKVDVKNACKWGYSVKFFMTSCLVSTCVEAGRKRTILKLEKNIRRCDLITVDELGYLLLDRMGAEHLFGFL